MLSFIMASIFLATVWLKSIADLKDSYDFLDIVMFSSFSFVFSIFCFVESTFSRATLRLPVDGKVKEIKVNPQQTW